MKSFFAVMAVIFISGCVADTSNYQRHEVRVAHQPNYYNRHGEPLDAIGLGQNLPQTRHKPHQASHYTQSVYYCDAYAENYVNVYGYDRGSDGAVTGAIVGAIAGNIIGKNSKSTLKGAIAGALIGSASDHRNDKQNVIERKFAQCMSEHGY